MAIDVVCSGCGRTFRVSDDKAGKKGKCPGCGTVIVIPGGADPQAWPPAAVDASSDFGPSDDQHAAVVQAESLGNMLWVDKMRFSAMPALLSGVVLAALSALALLVAFFGMPRSEAGKVVWRVWAGFGYFLLFMLCWLAWTVLTWRALRMAGDPDAPAGDREFVLNWAR